MGHANGTYHWDGASLRLQLSVIDSVSAGWQAEMEATVYVWNISTVLNLTVNSIDDGSSARSCCSTANGKIRVSNSAYATNGLGLASLNVDSNNHILWGTAKLNESYSMTADEKNSVMCQEVGHLFSMGHTSENGSSQNTCMDYSSNPSDGIWPNAHAYELLK